MSNRLENLSIPALKEGFVASPKTVMAYLNQGCVIRQEGNDKVYSLDPMPLYYLVAGMHWEVRVYPEHVQALETLELVELDCGSDRNWISNASFNIPTPIAEHSQSDIKKSGS